jgi:hypothetical protein
VDATHQTTCVPLTLLTDRDNSGNVKCYGMVVPYSPGMVVPQVTLLRSVSWLLAETDMTSNSGHILVRVFSIPRFGLGTLNRKIGMPVTQVAV